VFPGVSTCYAMVRTGSCTSTFKVDSHARVSTDADVVNSDSAHEESGRTEYELREKSDVTR
jgi:hypothetical protein